MTLNRMGTLPVTDQTLLKVSRLYTDFEEIDG